MKSLEASRGVCVVEKIIEECAIKTPICSYKLGNKPTELKKPTN